MKLIGALFVFVFAATGLIAQTPPLTNAVSRASADAPGVVGAWSDSVKDPTNSMSLRARLVLSEGASPSGSRAAVAYLDLQNISSAGNTLNVHYDTGKDGLACELRDPAGQTVPPMADFRSAANAGVLSRVAGSISPACSGVCASIWSSWPTVDCVAPSVAT